MADTPIGSHDGMYGWHFVVGRGMLLLSSQLGNASKLAICTDSSIVITAYCELTDS